MKIRGTSEIDQELDDIRSTCAESERLKEETGKKITPALPTEKKKKKERKKRKEKKEKQNNTNFLSFLLNLKPNLIR